MEHLRLESYRKSIPDLLYMLKISRKHIMYIDKSRKLKIIKRNKLEDGQYVRKVKDSVFIYKISNLMYSDKRGWVCVESTVDTKTWTTCGSSMWHELDRYIPLSGADCLRSRKAEHKKLISDCQDRITNLKKSIDSINYSLDLMGESR